MCARRAALRWRVLGVRAHVPNRCQPSTPTPVPPREHHPGVSVSPLSALSPIRATPGKVVPQLPPVRPAVAG